MLTRRQQRIKAIQCLFAYEQQCGAALASLQESIGGHLLDKAYAPEALKKNQEHAASLRPMTFSQILHHRQHAEPSFQKALATHLTQRQRIAWEIAHSLGTQQKDIENSCLRVLLLCLELAKEAPMLAAHPFIQRLGHMPALAKECRLRKLHWKQHLDGIGRWTRLLRKHKVYLDAAEDSSFTADTLWVQKLVKKFILKEHSLCACMEEDYFCWEENKKVVERFLLDMIKNDQKKGEHVWIFYPLSSKLGQAFMFVQTLYEQSVAQNEEWEGLIEVVAKNWETQRMTHIDKMIMKTALSELVHGPHIPLRVSLHEYIEIAKAYSSPQSGAFVHGMLDAMAKKLEAQGRLQKQAFEPVNAADKIEHKPKKIKDHE